MIGVPQTKHGLKRLKVTCVCLLLISKNRLALLTFLTLVAPMVPHKSRLSCRNWVLKTLAEVITELASGGTPWMVQVKQEMRKA